MIAALAPGVEVGPASREYTRSACGHRIRKHEWVASYDKIDVKGKHHPQRYCETCAVARGLAAIHEDRPRKRVADLAAGDRVVTQYGVRRVIRRTRDARDGRPMVILGNSQGEPTGYYIYDSEEVRVVLA